VSVSRGGEGSAPDRFGAVFSLLLASFLAAAVLDGRLSRIVTLMLYATSLILALRSATFPARAPRYLPWGLLAGSVLVVVLVAATTSRVVEGSAALWTAGIVLLTVFVVVGKVLRHRVVTLQTILGALSAYLLLGFFFAAMFTAVAKLSTQPFFADGEPADSDSIQYFTFITLTTTGYGDLSPAGQPGRSLAVLDALFGQIFLVTLVARLVTVFGTVRHRPDSSVGEESRRPDPK
jgi:hypothetical protein